MSVKTNQKQRTESQISTTNKKNVLTAAGKRGGGGMGIGNAVLNGSTFLPFIDFWVVLSCVGRSNVRAQEPVRSLPRSEMTCV